MSLPNVKISFAQGALGTVAQSADGVVGLISTATASTKFALNKDVVIYSSAALEELDITSVNNPNLHKAVTEFYAQAGEGAELHLYGMAGTAVVDLLGGTETFLKAASGRIRALVVVCTTGVDKSTLQAAATKAQSVGENATNTLCAPVFTLIPVKSNTDVAELPDLSTYTHDRVGFFIGDTVANSATSASGLIAGRIAECPVQRHIGRVKDGALSIASAYIGANDVAVADVETLYNKGYITMRTFVGKSGYFYAEDYLACGANNDYRSIARRRTADKAFRVAYATLLESVQDELPVTAAGTLTSSFAKSLETDIEADIYHSMTEEGNLSVDAADPTDMGVQAKVNTSNDVLATNKLQAVIKIKPYGYSKWIEVALGFLKN